MLAAIVASSGSGKLTGVTNVQRVNTSGGQLDGPCPVPGIHAEPYSADYIFLRK